MELYTLGIDLSKNYFQLHGVDRGNRPVLRKRLPRSKFIEYIPQIPKCRIVMEAGTAAHYWARLLQSHGHEVKLIAPQFVKAFLKSNKNDANDAEAIAIASTHPSMRYISIKAAWQVELQSLIRIRSRIVGNRVQLTNSIRGHLLEY